jgi:hypothetical protein
MPRDPLFRRTIVAWLVLCAVVLWENRDLFRTQLFEQADDAANALSIDRAKHGREIYGNYSRFNFRHPGPAFVYVYAAGEIVLEDWLGAISPRQNAHILTGILLQAAFLALAIGIAASHSADPWRATCLLAGVALVHFSLVPGAFSQVWPPLAQIMPETLFVVAAASVAAGRARHAVWLALSAGFLLHGHIAQIMFVGGVLLAVLGILVVRRLKRGPMAPPSRAQCLLIALIAALTVLPWIIDATRGRESNIFNIWLHVRQSKDDPLRPSWLKAAADTASYFCYCTRQDEWFSPVATLALLQFLKTYFLGILAASAGFACCVRVLWRDRGSGSPSAQFQRHLAAVCSLSVILCVVWARRQDGGIYFFNSLFEFGLMMAIWAIPVLTLAEKATGGGMAMVVTALAGALVATAGRYGEKPVYIGPDTLGLEAAAKVPRWLSMEPRPGTAKLLIFAHDDWDAAVTVAAALNRRGVRFFVPESDSGAWTGMFGEDRVLHSLGDAQACGPFSWWRPALAQPLNGETLVRDMGDESSDHGRSRFPFEFDLQHPSESFGLSKPEGGWTWTESRVVLMRLWTETARSDVRITFRASALPSVHGETQRVHLLVNGTMLPEILVTELSDYSITVPQALWNGGSSPGLIDLDWGLPDSGRPAAQAGSTETDRRLLGIRLRKLEFALVDR